MSDILSLSTRLESIRKDPSLVQSYMLTMLEEVSNGGIVIVDPNNPFALGLEMATALAVNNITEATQLTRKTYPSLADNLQDVYSHMSDYDYRDIFAVPGTVKFVFLMDKEEALTKTVSDPSNPGIRKLTIPRYTTITVSETNFTLLYPIDIKFVRHGGILITYDNDSPTPLQPLTTNMLVWDIVVVDGREYLRIEVELLQLKVERYIPQLNASSGFSRVFNFKGYFHFCRAFLKGANETWVEIRTTHSSKVYDPKVATVVLQVVNEGLLVTIPQVYTNTGLIADAVRLDIYTTRGPINLTLNLLEPESFKTYWDGVPNEKLNIFSAPILTMDKISVYSTDIVNGGNVGMNYLELRHRVVNRSLNTEGLPITNKQLQNRLTDLGYQLVTNIDNITDRQFLATKRLPLPGDRRTVTGISASIETLQRTLLELELSPHVSRSNLRHAIKPGMLYEMVDGKVEIVDHVRQANLQQLKVDSPEMLSRVLNRGEYLYSPFYYVIDSSVDDFGCRVYDLDTPKFVRRFFNDMNDVGTNFSFREYDIIVNPSGTGYLLSVVMDVGQIGLELGPDYLSVQLSYKGKDSKTRYWINGVLATPIDPDTDKPVDNEYIYQFAIETRYDVDTEDRLVLYPYKDPIPLLHDFDVISIIKDFIPFGEGNSPMDDIVNKTLLVGYDVNRNYTCLSHDKVTIEFGNRLKHLWHRTRTIPEYDAFERYEADVLDYYEDDVFLLDTNGKPKITKDPDTGGIKLTKLHSKGDRKVDVYGDTIYKYRKGDIKTDIDGNPIITGGGRGLQRHIDLFLLDARYLYVDNVKDINYRKAVHNEVVDWCTTDMVSVYNQLLERSELFFYPVRTAGRVNVLADSNQHVSVNAEQRFKVTYWLTEENYKNATLRDMIEKQTVLTLQQSLTRHNVSIDAMLDDLRLALGQNIVSVRVDGFTDGLYSTVTLKDGSMGLSVGKTLRLLSNNQLEMADDVTVSFVVHGL